MEGGRRKSYPAVLRNHAPGSGLRDHPWQSLGFEFGARDSKQGKSLILYTISLTLIFFFTNTCPTSQENSIASFFSFWFKIVGRSVCVFSENEVTFQFQYSFSKLACSLPLHGSHIKWDLLSSLESLVFICFCF